MALPVIVRDIITDPHEKRDILKHWYPPPNPGAPFVDLVTPTPVANGVVTTLADGTRVRGVRRSLLVNLPLNFPSGLTGTRSPGATSAQMWVLRGDAPPTFPSETLRVVENDVIQSDTTAATGTHTIHWHGIEPTPMNDGVGKQSFELSAFVYQFAVNQAGTYFYHCHKNTVLHFEMGLYGLVLIDPKANAFPGTPQEVAPPFTSGGRGCVQAAVDPAVWGTRNVPSFTGNVPVVDYDVEAIWVCDDIDTLWHNNFSVNESMANSFAVPGNIDDAANRALFTQPDPSHGNLNDFRPDIFVISGIPQVGGAVPEGGVPAIPDENLPPINGGAVSVTCRVGQKVLVRLLNASYCTQQYTLGLDATAIAMDGRPFGIRAEGKYSKPFTIPAGRRFRLTTARRVDLLIKPTRAGVFTFKTEFFSMFRGFKIGRAITTITVNP